MTKSRGILSPRKIWSDDEIALLKTKYPNERAEDVAKMLGCSIDLVYAKASRLKLKKSEIFKSSPASGRLDGVRGAAGRFQNGNQSWNKGLHYDVGGRSVETRFKPGKTPHNTVAVGTTVLATDGYYKTKVAEPNKWKWTHRMNWEAVHGPIAKGMMLVFKNSDRLNCDPSNLELITRQEHMSRHTLYRYPKEITQLIQLRGAVQRKINRRLKDEQANNTTSE